MSEKGMAIKLSGDEALIVFDFFTRNEKALDSLATYADQIALAAILAPLEKHLVSPFRENYSELVEAACVRLLAENES